MVKLDESEIGCLRKIADEPSSRDPPCSEDVLKRLLDLGLIDCRPKLWAPLEAVDTRYHLTPAGELFLKRNGSR